MRWSKAHVRDEILYREGMALGLDRDDELIRRRVRQKFEVIAEEESARSMPSDADLEAYLTANAGRFTAPAKVSFEQIFFDRHGTSADLERAIDEARRALARGADPARLGQASMLPGRVEATAQPLVARDFGAEFARQLEAAPLGQWSGPIRSGFGAHLVRVTAREPAARPELGRGSPGRCARLGRRAPRERARRELPQAPRPLHGRDRGQGSGHSGRAAMSRSCCRWWLLGWLLLVLMRPAVADEFRPAYLHLHEIDATRYDVLWKVPALDESVVLKVAPLFPPARVRRRRCRASMPAARWCGVGASRSKAG
jgi:hypothetical protein